MQVNKFGRKKQRIDVLLGVLITFLGKVKKFQKKMKKSVDNRGWIWYIIKAPREREAHFEKAGQKSFLKKFKKSIDKPIEKWYNYKLFAPLGRAGQEQSDLYLVN